MKHTLVAMLLLFTNSVFAPNKDVDFKISTLAVKEDTLSLLHQVLYGECRGCSNVELTAVIGVIKNRLAHKDFPKTLKEVLTEKNQFHMDTNLVVSVCFKTIADTLMLKPSSHAFLYFACLDDVRNDRILKWIRRHKLTRIGRQHFWK